MYRTLRTLSIPVLLAAAFAASAQTPSQNTAGGNPAARGERSSYFYGGIKNNAAPTPSGNSITRPTARFGPVTPVPEPSEWAMLIVGLTFVGWIVRRKTKQ